LAAAEFIEIAQIGIATTINCETAAIQSELQQVLMLLLLR
jgi:hypothetical protein